MTRRLLLSAVALVSLAVPLTLSAQDAATQLRPFTRTLPEVGLTLSLVHLNPRTVPVLFQPPTLYAIRARAAEATMLYVQGTAEMPVKLNTTTFVIEQDGMSVTATPMNINRFEKGTVSLASGQRVDGVLVFERRIDISRPFMVKHGGASVEFKFGEEQLRLIAEASPQAQ